MANINQDLQAIMQARYGREVRGSIHDAIRDINIESTNAKEVAITSRDSALVNANKAEAEATRAESYAKGGTGTREGEDTDNAEYYKTQTEHLSQGFEVIDSLESTNPYHPLSARQGNVLDGKISTINGKVGVANGIASLDSTGRIPYSQLPESAMEYKGTWNANTNTPTLVSGQGDSGDFYVVSVAGTWNNIDWAVGDRVLFDDVTAHEWARLPAGEVQSVNGKVGAVELEAGDIPFDKGSSPLTSNNTNDAILEVLQKAGVQVISTTMADYLAHKVDYDRSGAIINITDTGVANSAGNVSYDNTESGLLSTTTQGAIDEINGKLPHVIEVTPDANETYNSILTRLKALIDQNTQVTAYSRLDIGSACFAIISNNISGSRMDFSYSTVSSANATIIRRISMHSSSAEYLESISGTVTNLSNTVCTNTIKYYY